MALLDRFSNKVWRLPHHRQSILLRKGTRPPWSSCSFSDSQYSSSSSSSSSISLCQSKHTHTHIGITVQPLSLFFGSRGGTEGTAFLTDIKTDRQGIIQGTRAMLISDLHLFRLAIFSLSGRSPCKFQNKKWDCYAKTRAYEQGKQI